jgi:AbrB family looped-hinge helix DNA binding protein
LNTILSATSRGQITLPKDWRDKFDTRYYKAEIEDGKIVIRPLITKKTLEDQVEGAWAEFKEGKVISEAGIIKKYGL